MNQFLELCEQITISFSSGVVQGWHYRMLQWIACHLVHCVNDNDDSDFRLLLLVAADSSHPKSRFNHVDTLNYVVQSVYRWFNATYTYTYVPVHTATHTHVLLVSECTSLSP